MTKNERNKTRRRQHRTVRTVIGRIGAFLLAAAMTGMFGSCESPNIPTDPSLPPVSAPWTSGQSLVCFGTSLTYGYYWEDPVWKPRMADTVIRYTPSTAYPALLAKTLTIPVYNAGFVGARTDRALKIVREEVLVCRPALVLLEFGANDFLQGVPDSVTGVLLGNLIDTLKNNGSAVILLSFLNETMIAAVQASSPLAGRTEEAYRYLRMLRRTAESRNVLLVEQTMNGIYWNESYLSPDQLHPNAAGYRMMQQNISTYLASTFRINGMVK